MSQHEWLAQAASYALDALDREERSAFESHLADCALCQAEVAAFREVAARLAAAVPEVSPAPALRRRVLAVVRRPLLSSWLANLRRPRQLAWLAIAASLVLVVGAGYCRERTQRRKLEQAVAGVRDSLDARDSLLNVMLSPIVRTANLAATGKPPSAKLFWNPARHIVVIAVFDLPPAPSGRTYQLWAIATGKAPVSLGVFNPGPTGPFMTAMAVPADLIFQVTAVTEEPAGGSPQPTQTPFLTGELTRFD